MSGIDIQLIKELRETTGSGMMDCRKALEATEGKMEEAIKWLRLKGLQNAEKKAGRIAAEGIIDSYIHGEGRVGVLLEVNIETDFAAKNEKFKTMVHDLSMQIAAMNPRWVDRQDIPEDIVANEREIAATQAKNEGKPEKIIEKIVEGRLEKFYESNCLLDQVFIKDESKKIKQLVTEMIAGIGENITVRRFVRFELGEGIEKKQDNFAEEVMQQLK